MQSSFILLLLVLFVSPNHLLAQSPDQKDDSSEPLVPILTEEAIHTNPATTVVEEVLRAPASVTWWNRHIVEFRSSHTQVPPDQRAENALERLERFATEMATTPVSTEAMELDGEPGHRFLVGGNYLFALLESDLNQLAGITLDESRDQALQTLAEIRELRAGATMSTARGVTFSLIATAILVVAVVLLLKLTRKLANLLDGFITKREFLNLKRVDLRPHLAMFSRQLVNVAAVITGLSVLTAYVTFVLNRFPLTAPTGLAFGQHLFGFGSRILSTIIAAVPGVVIAILILLVTRWLANMLSVLLSSIGQNTPGSVMSPETAKATRRIAVVAVWLFGIVLAYPYLPGSGSQAFQGVSVLLGLMVSLGSAGMINQVMSGFVLLYSGSVRTGEYVQVGQIEGKITEIGFLAVKLLTPKREFITIPNAVMLSNPTTNFTRLKDRLGVPISCKVTIGYDTPWRLVHDLLLAAAEKTEDIMEKPPPKVIQKALSDWYPEYVLTCYVENPEVRISTLSELNGHIQDGFNEAGVQIMSPHYREDPAQPIVVPREKWFPPGMKTNTPPELEDTRTRPAN